MCKKYYLLAGFLVGMLWLSGCSDSNQDNQDHSITHYDQQEVTASNQATQNNEVNTAMETELLPEKETELLLEEETEVLPEEETEYYNDGNEASVETIWIDCPSLDFITSNALDEIEVQPMKLTKLLEEENSIVDTPRWLSENGFENQIDGNTPGYTFSIIDHYDPYSYTGYVLEIKDSTTEEVVYKVDLSAFYDPSMSTSGDGYITNWYAEYRFAHLEDHILYVAMAHRTYAETMPYTAFIVAIDLDNQLLLWKSQNLVCNANSFVIVDDVIICGYGFTDEDDYLYQLNKMNGRLIGTPIKLRTGPDYFFLKDNQLYVRTYNTNYIFTLEKEP